MTTVRCPSCDAAVPADAAWCTLCFAQLGAQPPTASPEPAPPVVAAPVAPEPVFSAPVPVAPVASIAPLALPLQPVAAPVAAATVLDEPTAPATPTWPCTGCDELVSLEETVCPTCGAGFMGGVSPSVSLKLPGVGDLTNLSAGGKFGVMAGGASLITVVLVLVFLVLGHLF